MKNFKLSRNLWLLAGFCFILAFVLNIVNNNFSMASVLMVITSILSFINAYNNHKKSLK